MFCLAPLYYCLKSIIYWCERIFMALIKFTNNFLLFYSLHIWNACRFVFAINKYFSDVPAMWIDEFCTKIRSSPTNQERERLKQNAKQFINIFFYKINKLMKNNKRIIRTRSVKIGENSGAHLQQPNGWPNAKQVYWNWNDVHVCAPIVSLFSYIVLVADIYVLATANVIFLIVFE